ncbi:MAG TPA: inorganic phosphate transporter [Candidatus Saccharimonadales bacterium]|jgi:inorganic phosphate transporter, PiT family|nr:inorganic phosphate transporter [Candidatus Saccharimonadales bacterium]
MADAVFVLTILIIAIALVFDYVNGFHDAANSIATIVSTRVLTPLQGVAWAAFWNFIAAFTFGTAVAKTVGIGLLDVQQIDSYVILAALLGAITWDLITWYIGLPTSSSHALIGAYAGAGIAKAGLGVIIPGGWISTLVFIVLAPLLGMALGMLNLVLILNIFRRSIPSNVDHLFRRGQLISAAAYSLGHGTNDAQKTMGIIAGALFTVPQYRHLVSDSAGLLTIPFWIVLMAHTAIGLGTLSGGWRIVHTMGSRITRLTPMGGFAAEAAGAITLLGAAHFGVPVSTTHTITGAIVGVGSLRRLRSVRWNVAGRIVWAWVLTIPASAAIAMFCWLLLNFGRKIF